MDRITSGDNSCSEERADLIPEPAPALGIQYPVGFGFAIESFDFLWDGKSSSILNK